MLSSFEYVFKSRLVFLGGGGQGTRLLQFWLCFCLTGLLQCQMMLAIKGIAILPEISQFENQYSWWWRDLWSMQ
jgi:hypothetical protein